MLLRTLLVLFLCVVARAYSEVSFYDGSGVDYLTVVFPERSCIAPYCEGFTVYSTDGASVACTDSNVTRVESGVFDVGVPSSCALSGEGPVSVSVVLRATWTVEQLRAELVSVRTSWGLYVNDILASYLPFFVVLTIVACVIATQ